LRQGFEWWEAFWNWLLRETGGAFINKAWLYTKKQEFENNHYDPGKYSPLPAKTHIEIRAQLGAIDNSYRCKDVNPSYYYGYKSALEWVLGEL
jgi:hypothetical protein